MDPKTEAYQAIQAYLAQNKTRLQVMDVDSIVWEVRLCVPKVALLADNDVRAELEMSCGLFGKPVEPVRVKLSKPPADPGRSYYGSFRASVNQVWFRGTVTAPRTREPTGPPFRMTLMSFLEGSGR